MTLGDFMGHPLLLVLFAIMFVRMPFILLQFVPIYILLVLLFWPLHHPEFLLLLMILSGCVMWFSDSVGSLISLYRYF